MFPPFCACPADGQGSDPWSRHRQRKLRLLRAWRDRLESQLAAVDAAISTLQRQLERDGARDPQPH